MLEQAHDSITASFLVNIERFGFFHYTDRVPEKCLDEEEYSLYLFSEKFQRALPLAEPGAGQLEKTESESSPSFSSYAGRLFL